MPDSAGQPTYFEVLTAALNEVAANGYQSPEQIDFWADQIRRAAERSMRSLDDVERMVNQAMVSVFRRQVDNGGALRLNPGVSAYTLQQLRPELHAELNRRIAASVDLIRLNRPQAVAKTMQRFRGWATSVPPGGTPKEGKARLKKVEQKQELRKALAQLPYEERRVVIDQSAKLFSAINSTVAVNGGALGAYWQSHKRQRGYNGRPVHNARDGSFYLVRDSWADKAGYVKVDGAAGWTGDVEQPAELPYCKCAWQYVFSLRSLPKGCLTAKGEEALAEARRKIANG